MQELRAQRDFSVSKQRPTQSRSVGPSISDAVGAHRFPTDWRLTVRRVGREERVSLIRSRNGGGRFALSYGRRSGEGAPRVRSISNTRLLAAPRHTAASCRNRKSWLLSEARGLG